MAEYLRGSISLERGERVKALAEFARAVSHNAYFARCLLNDRVDEKLPCQLEQIADHLRSSCSLQGNT